MSALEDRLRAAYSTDAPVPDLLPEVRRGARQRRARRTTGLVVATALSVVAVVAVAVSLSGGSAAPPTPPTTQSPTPLGLTDVVDVAAAGDQVFVLAGGQLWLRDDTWRVIHDFDDDTFEYLVAASNGRDLWAWGGLQSTRLWSSHDGGATWKRSDVPANPEYGYQVAVAGPDVWVQTHDADGLWQYFRSPIGSDAWSRSEGPEGWLYAAGGRPVILTYASEDTSSPVLEVSDDRGASWRPLPLPCRGENSPYPAESEVFLLCPLGRDGAQVYRSAGGVSRWEEFGRTTGVVKDVEVLSDDTLLVVGRTSVLLTASGSEPVSTDLGEGAWDVAVAGDRAYLVSQENVLLVSTDGGRTWSPE